MGARMPFPAGLIIDVRCRLRLAAGWRTQLTLSRNSGRSKHRGRLCFLGRWFDLCKRRNVSQTRTQSLARWEPTGTLTPNVRSRVMQEVLRALWGQSQITAHLKTGHSFTFLEVGASVARWLCGVHLWELEPFPRWTLCQRSCLYGSQGANNEHVFASRIT